ncbi:hypothetical protein ABW19_dt0201613 [Dactylella cylindrospora]|nr:hypothetical protein ABW19_dt0201613 [Dactylella cylindrospora]
MPCLPADLEMEYRYSPPVPAKIPFRIEGDTTDYGAYGFLEGFEADIEGVEETPELEEEENDEVEDGGEDSEVDEDVEVEDDTPDMNMWLDLAEKHLPPLPKWVEERMEERYQEMKRIAAEAEAKEALMKAKKAEVEAARREMAKSRPVRPMPRRRVNIKSLQKGNETNASTPPSQPVVTGTSLDTNST